MIGGMHQKLLDQGVKRDDVNADRSMAIETQRKERLRGDAKMTITVVSPRGTKLFTFPGDLHVSEAVKEIVKAFDLSTAYDYGLLLSCNASTPLRPDLTLAAYDIRDGSSLYFTIKSRRDS